MNKIEREYKELVGGIRAQIYRVYARNDAKYECPICSYTGPFMTSHDASGPRPDATCPRCSGGERQRLLWLTVQDLGGRFDLSQLRLLHFAPERQLTERFRKMFGAYATADLNSRWADHKVDLRNLPLPDESYDVVIACHVMEHIKEDGPALQNIRRVLRPGGFAILQVPLFGPRTVEYAEPNPVEWGHVRAPGEDYFERYERVFARVERIRSSQFERRFQPYVFEDRINWPAGFTMRPTSPGFEHEDIVPVCFV